MDFSNNQSGIVDSAYDALRFSNIFYRFFYFFVFGFITSTPYLIKNLNNVWSIAQSKGINGAWIIYYYIEAVMTSAYHGIFLGLSTVFDTTYNIIYNISNVQVGTIIFCIFMVIFATLTLFQPLQLLFNIFDFKRGEVHSKVLIFFVSFFIVFIIISPISYSLLDGQTILTGIDNSLSAIKPIDNSTTQNNSTNYPINATIINDSVAVINLIVGDDTYG